MPGATVRTCIRSTVDQPQDDVPNPFSWMLMLRERLRLVIATALAVAPGRVKKAFADRRSPKTEETSRVLSEARHRSRAASL